MKKKEILVIDDEDGIRNILEDILSHEGYTVKTVSKGAGFPRWDE